MSKSKNSFLGTGWSFPPEFDYETKSVGLVSDEEDIRQSIRIIMGTLPGERTLLPEFGCDLGQYVFRPIDSTNLSMLKATIYDALLHNEPRIKDIEISFEEINYEEELSKWGQLKITVEYTVIITNTRSNMVYPFYTKEGTNL